MEDKKLIEAYGLTYKPVTLRVVARILRIFQEFMAARKVPILQAKESDIMDFRQHLLVTRKSEYSVDQAVGQVRRFYRWCVSQGYADLNPAASIKGKVHPKRKPPTAEEVERLVAAAEAAVVKTRGIRHSHRVARRVQLVVHLASESGVRPEELSRLTLADFDRATRSVLIGRGSVSERTVPVSRAAWKHLILYLRVTGKRRVGGAGYLFHQLNNIDKPKNPDSITMGLETLVRGAGLRPELTAVNLARNVIREIVEVADLDVALAVSGRTQLITAAVNPVDHSVAELRAAIEQYHPLGRRTLADLRRSASPK